MQSMHSSSTASSDLICFTVSSSLQYFAMCPSRPQLLHLMALGSESILHHCHITLIPLLLAILWYSSSSQYTTANSSPLNLLFCFLYGKVSTFEGFKLIYTYKNNIPFNPYPFHLSQPIQSNLKNCCYNLTNTSSTYGNKNGKPTISQANGPNSSFPKLMHTLIPPHSGPLKY